MRKVMGVVAALAFACVARASDLNISVEADGSFPENGSNVVEAGAGSTVAYRVIGELSDDMNEGLALAGFDVIFAGGPLEQAFEPTTNPMKNFAIGTENLGINNPAGYGGTPMGGSLIQVGGGQNTINNNAGNAPFPIGAVITGVAQPGSPQILVMGELTAPNEPGDYALTVSNVFANVIKEGEDGDPFWRTEAANSGSIINLIVRVPDGGDVPALLTSAPASNSIDARQPSDLDGTNPVGWSSVQLDFDGDFSFAAAGDFEVSAVGAGAAPAIMNVTPAGNTVTVDFNGPIPPATWTVLTVSETGDKVCLGYLPADVSGDRTSGPLDILRIIDCLNAVQVCAIYQGDVDRSGQTNPQDILRVIDLLNGAASFDTWNGQSLPASPCN
jgi:hypothetical protein